jgi:hypothetical protein
MHFGSSIGNPNNDTRYKTQDSRLKIQDTEHETWDMKRESSVSSLKSHVSCLASCVLCLVSCFIFCGIATASVVDEIRIEATRPNYDGIGRPLPLASHWVGCAPGITADDHIDMIEQGHHIFPIFILPWPDNQGPYYAENAIKRAARMNLPIAFVSTQWEFLLSREPYISIDTVDGVFSGDEASESTNPNVIARDGSVLEKVSPFGPQGQIDLWREVGGKWSSNPAVQAIQNWYPNPPLVIFISNNEYRKLLWWEAETSERYIETYIDEEAGMDDETRGNYRRRVFGDGWIPRYRALIEGFRDGLIKQWWRDKSVFIGYEAFGPSFFNRLDDIWSKYSLTTTYVGNLDTQPNSVPRIDPWHFAWDGTTSSFYVLDADPSTDYQVWSPQIGSMNWLFMLEETYLFNPEFWFEMSVWDGHNIYYENLDKRKYYEQLGQIYTPDRYKGMVQFGMWLMRPRVVREFRYYNEAKEETLPYYTPIIESVDRVYKDPILQSFWRTGQLVANPVGQHPYQSGILDGYRDDQIEERYGIGRWFLLSTNFTPEIPPNSLDTEIPVLSLALVMGEFPDRQWLVYAHSPLTDREYVEIVIPEYKSIVVDVSVGGSFYLVDESENTVTPIIEQPPVVIQEQIELNESWNLISLPLDPEDDATLSVLEPILDSCDSVWTYNSFTESWNRYIINGPSSLNDLIKMEPGVGYWINMTRKETLMVSGYEITYMNIPLKKGWNQVGYNFLSQLPVEAALSSIYGICHSISTYDSSTKSWLNYAVDGPDFLNNLSHLKPGRGYWIIVADNCTWDISIPGYP